MGSFAYFPHTEDDIKVMLERIGVKSMDDLYSDVPAEFIRHGEYDLPSAMSEALLNPAIAESALFKVSENITVLTPE